MSRMRLSQIVNFGSLLVVLTVAACSKDPIGPGEPADTLAGLVVSEAIVEPTKGDGAAGLAYISLPPGKLRFGGSVEIQNVTAGAAVLPPVPVIDGGFDPVAVPASNGDQLQLTIRNSQATRMVGAAVPDRRDPVVVRTSVQQSPDEVPSDARPRVVFSEPIDAGTLPGSVRITRGATLVSDRFAIVPGEPWIAELDPAVELEPMTTYELSVDAAIRDLAGESLQAPLRVTFTTLFEIDGGGRVAFVSDRDGGESHIYVIDPDGTGLTRVAAGWAPAWSPDGTRLAFYRNGIHVIDADGSDERLIVANGHAPAWSPDGRRVAFERGVDLYVVNADGSEEVLLVSGFSVSTEMGINAELRSPAWSPAGRRIAFSTTEGSILLAHADGSGIRRLTLEGEEFHLAFLGEPAWSPDGSRIAFTIDNSKIASATLDGRDVRVHTEPGYGPEWSADGAYLVYHYLVQTGQCDWYCPARIRVVDPATGRFRRLVPEVVGAHPEYSDSSPVWSR